VKELTTMNLSAVQLDTSIGSFSKKGKKSVMTNSVTKPEVFLKEGDSPGRF
jgi:hypothetical protein